MSKRKRQDDIDGIDDDRRRHQARFSSRFEQSVNELTEALKLARGFERQKLGRRQKQASEEPKTLLRLREEVIVLKQLDLEKTAKNHLLKHLSKIKRIRESPIFIHFFGSSPKILPVQSSAEANVIGLLFKSAPVKAVVDRTVASTYAELGLQPGTTLSAPKRIDGEVSSRLYEQAAAPKVPSKYTTGSPDEDNSDVLQTQVVDLTQPEKDDADSFASFDSESINNSASSSPPLVPEATTAFLPALGMGGYYSGSDSEVSDVDTTEPEVRKNRRGQRARQQLAELKYGRNAKHLQKSPTDNGRDTGWDAKRGAVGGNTRSKDVRSRNGAERLREGFSRQKDATVRKEKSKTRDDAGPIHPSWQAAKQRKQQSAGPAAFTGRKITFD